MRRITATFTLLLLTSSAAAAPAGPSRFNSLSSTILQLFLFMMLIAGCAIGFRWQLKRRTASPFKCSKCGYDLRGSMNPGTVTCPECGWVYE